MQFFSKADGLDPERFALCQQLAQQIEAFDDPTQTQALLEAHGWPVPMAENPTPPSQASRGQNLRPISIWSPVEDSGTWFFQRPPLHPLGDHYADNARFALAKPEGTQRVCFFGESVAAGYLYAPELTPSKILAELLHEPDHPTEVIDLARTNERLGTLLETAESALQLQPDWLVLFVGNNWNLLETPDLSPFVPNPKARKRFGELLSKGGLDAVLLEASRQVGLRAEAILQKIAELAGQAGAQVLVIIPEVNLADWQSLQPPPLLSGAALVSWHQHLSQAFAAMTESRWQQAKAEALAMLALDDGACPTGYRILSRVWLAEGLDSQARSAAEAEVDSTHYASLCFLGSPRAGSLTLASLRRFSQRSEVHSVSLPELFREVCGSQLPGRRFFLDYCHLTYEGLVLAMRAVADKIAPEFGQGLATKPNLAPVAPAIHARAYLGAAVHTAHRECAVTDKRERIVYWLREALAADPGIHSTILDLVRVRCSRLPAVLTEAQGRNYHSPYRLLLQHGWRYDHVDAQLLEAIRLVLDDPEVDSLLARGSGETKLDLADPYWLWEPLHRFYPELMGFDDLAQRAFQRVPWPELSLCLLSNATQSLVLKACLRIPGLEADQRLPVGLSLNGETLAELLFSRDWSNQFLVVPQNMLVFGLNKLTLHWPLEPAANWDPKSCLDQLSRGEEGPLHPIFGEIFSLRVSPLESVSFEGSHA